MKRTAPPSRTASTSASPITRGHWRSLELLDDTRVVLDTLGRYERALGSPVYLRPTDRGLTVLSLDSAPLAMVGVGPAKGGCSLSALPPSEAHVAASVAAYRQKVAGMKRRSPEERYVVGRIRAALQDRLQLGDGLEFLHQEWRFVTRGKLDLLAIDAANGQLVVIEVKQSEGAALDAATLAQGHAYAAELTAAWPEYVRYFRRLAAALSRVYAPDAPSAAICEDVPVRCEVWWPGGRQRTSVLPRATGGTEGREPVRPAEDATWRRELADCAAAEAYRATLTPRGLETFEARTLEDMVNVIERTIGASWVAAFRDRYLTRT